MDNNIKIESWPKRWYTYNKQKIPMYFTLIGTFFFTAFLDFEMQVSQNQLVFLKKILRKLFNIELTSIKLNSHIAAIRKFLDSPYNNLSGFYLFAIYLVAIIQLFNTFSFAKKRSPFGLFLITFLTALQVAMVGLYTSIFFLEQANRHDYVIDHVATFSFTTFIIGAIFFVIGTVFAWFYVNWKYVKEVE